jgi:hypothetical protein
MNIDKENVARILRGQYTIQRIRCRYNLWHRWTVWEHHIKQDLNFGYRSDRLFSHCVDCGLMKTITPRDCSLPGEPEEKKEKK